MVSWSGLVFVGLLWLGCLQWFWCCMSFGAGGGWLGRPGWVRGQADVPRRLRSAAVVVSAVSGVCPLSSFVNGVTGDLAAVTAGTEAGLQL